MASYDISPLSAMGGVVKAQSLTELLTNEGAPHSNWVERLRLATDFITADNTLICVADHWLHNQVVNVKPIGLTQSFNFHEQLNATLAGEVGSRRKRAMIGSSGGGSISISKMVCLGESPMYTLTQGTALDKTLGIDSTFWSEKEWLALLGLNHDAFRTAVGIIVIEGAPTGETYAAYMFEQCIIQGSSRAYAAGQHLVADNVNMIYEQIIPLWSGDVAGGVDYGTTV